MTCYSGSLKSIQVANKCLRKRLLIFIVIPQLVIHSSGKIQDLWSSVPRFKSGPMHVFYYKYIFCDFCFFSFLQGSSIKSQKVNESIWYLVYFSTKPLTTCTCYLKNAGFVTVAIVVNDSKWISFYCYSPAASAHRGHRTFGLSVRAYGRTSVRP